MCFKPLLHKGEKKKYIQHLPSCFFLMCNSRETRALSNPSQILRASPWWLFVFGDGAIYSPRRGAAHPHRPIVGKELFRCFGQKYALRYSSLNKETGLMWYLVAYIFILHPWRCYVFSSCLFSDCNVFKTLQLWTKPNNSCQALNRRAYGNHRTEKQKNITFLLSHTQDTTQNVFYRLQEES